jgi:hypothetical protein
MSQLLSRRALVGAVVALVALWFTPAGPGQVPGDAPAAPPVTVLPIVPAVPSVNVAGRWTGTWDDTGTGHHGPLRAHITCTDGCHYHAVFHGRFRKVIPFLYSVDFTVVGYDGDAVLLAGDHTSGLTGRVYHFTARATACTFTAEFCSDKYHGHFDLSR